MRRSLGNFLPVVRNWRLVSNRHRLDTANTTRYPLHTRSLADTIHLLPNSTSLLSLFRSTRTCILVDIRVKWLANNWIWCDMIWRMICTGRKFNLAHKVNKKELKLQEMWANAHETLDSISLISYAACLGLSPVISAQFTLEIEMYAAASNRKKITKTPILGVHGHSRSSMLVPPESLSTVLVITRSKSMFICNHSRARLVDSSRNRTFWRGYPNLMRSYGGLLEPKGSSLTPLKSTFNAENFMCRLYWSITRGMCVAASSRKNHQPPYFWSWMSFRVIDVGTTGKIVSSAYYNTQQVCVYLQPFSR